MKYILKEDGLIISEATEAERTELKGLLAELARSDSQGPRVTEQMLTELDSGKFYFWTLKQFSKWCHTAGRYSEPELVAQEISSLMFGKLIPRLCDQENKVTTFHIEKFKDFLISLNKEGIMVDPDEPILN